MPTAQLQYQDVSYVYDSHKKIQAVLLPYALYLNFIKNKRKALLTDTVSNEQVGYHILVASIKKLQESGVRLSEIAKKLNVSQPYISKLLKKPVNVGSDTLDKYLRILDTIESNVSAM
jgi:predicted DNA-binding protein YlxM (UPF0122 family)